MGEMRAQERKPCRREPNDCKYAEEGWCGSDECNGDGTRWVTVGRLVDSAFTQTDLGIRGSDALYTIEKSD